MSLLIPEEVGEFFEEGKKTLAQINLTLATASESAQQIGLLAEKLNTELDAWRRLRERLQAAVPEPNP